jgi:hypothetical protein
MTVSTRRILFICSLVGACTLFLAGLSRPVWAAPLAQFTSFPTPTPGPDGRIIYIAQEGDSAWRIAAIFGLKLDNLRTLNKWGETPNIKAGDKILLGLAGPAEASATPGPTPTSAPVLPTPSPKPGWGNLCILLYNDANGDSIREEEELTLPKGEVSVTDRSGTVSKTATTGSGADPICFQQLPEGTFNVSVAIPKGYNATTAMNQTITLKAGDISQLNFGAQADTQTQVEAPTPQGSGKSPILAVAGALLLVVGIGLAFLAARLALGKRTGKSDS